MNVVFSNNLVSASLANGTTLTDSFFNLDPLTGGVTVFHPLEAEGSTFSVEIIATETALNQAIVAYSWTYSVVVVTDDVLNRTSEPFPLEFNGVSLTEDVMPSKLAVGTSYRFNAPASNTIVSHSDVNALYFSNVQGQVVYRFDRISGTEQPPSGDVLIDTTTGSIFLSPSSEYNVTYELIATDESGRRALLMTWQFETQLDDTATATNGPNGLDCVRGVPRDIVPFDLSFECDCNGTQYSGENCDSLNELPQLILEFDGQYIPNGENPDQFTFFGRTLWAWGETYQVAPVNLTRAFSIVPNYLGGSENETQNHTVSFRLEWDGAAPSRGFFVDSSTGEMLIRIPNGVVSNNSARLIAESPNTVSAVVENITYNFLPEDIANPDASGPNGMSCVHGSPTDTYDGLSEFDLRYTCVCQPPFGGDNCDQDLTDGSASSASESGETTTTYAGISVVVGAFLIVLAISRYQVHRARQKPVDMSAVQDAILMNLGLGGASLNFGKDEFGLMIEFGHGVLTEFHDDHNKATLITEHLLTSVRGLPGLPNRLSSMLKDKSTTAVIEPAQTGILLRMKRPKNGEIKSGTEESFVAVLQRRIEEKKVCIDGQHYACDVSVAVPKRVPQELDRHTILRLEVLVSFGIFSNPNGMLIMKTASRALVTLVKFLKQQ